MEYKNTFFSRFKLGLKRFKYKTRNKYFFVTALLIVLSLITYSSYALFVVLTEGSTAANMKMHDLMYSYSYITSSDSTPQTTNSGGLPVVTVTPNTTLFVDLTFNNVASIPSKYKLYYKADTPSTLPSGVSVKYSNISPDEINGEISEYGGSDDSKTVRIVIINNSASSVSINLAAKPGYAYKQLSDIIFESNEIEIDDVYNEILTYDGDVVLRTFIDGYVQTNFPTDFDTYMYDESGSNCTNGAILTWNGTTHKVDVSNITGNTICNVNFVTKQDTVISIFVNNVAVQNAPSSTSGYTFDSVKSNCTNGASVTWNTTDWEANISNVTEANTSCSIYFNPLLLTDIAEAGDFVAYTPSEATWQTTTAIPTTQGNFGGWTAGQDKSTSVTCYGTNEYASGWRVLSNDGEEIKLISAGTPECYYHSYSETGYSEASVALLTATSGANAAITKYGSNLSESVKYFDKTDLDTWNGSTVAYGTEITNNLIKIGALYWLASSYDSASLWNVGSVGHVSRSNGIGFGLRPLITLKSNIQVVSGSGESIANAYQITL